MARKSSSSTFTMALLGIGAYLAYENWPAISAWFGSVASATPAAAAISSGYYPNSPVPSSYSTAQTFVDTAGNQWQFSTQTNAWVIATPGPAPASPSPGTVVSTAPPPPAPTLVIPASAGTIVAATSAPPAAPGVAVSQARLNPVLYTLQPVAVAAAPGAPSPLSTVAENRVMTRSGGFLVNNR